MNRSFDRNDKKRGDLEVTAVTAGCDFVNRPTLKLLQTLLVISGIEPNPGPPKKAKKKIATPQHPKKHTQVSKPKSGIFTKIGSTIGGIVGGTPGRLIASAGSWLGKITGMGDYKLNRNTLMTNSGPPVFSSGRGFNVAHREFVRDISGSTSFTNTSTSINPGLPGFFPWLSQIAQNFEEYEFRGLVVEFRSTSANALNSTNTALGTVVMATEYNVERPAFATKQAMEAYEFCTSSSPSNTAVHPVECDPRRNVYARQYIRSGALALGDDKAKYDLGNFQLATIGMQAAAIIGELWVSYDVTFYKPRLPPSSATIRPGFLFWQTNPPETGTGTQPGGTTSSGYGTTYFDNIPNAHVDLSINVAAPRIFLGDVGCYLVVVIAAQSSATGYGSPPILSPGINCSGTAPAIFRSPTNALSSFALTQTSNATMRMSTFRVTTAGLSTDNAVTLTTNNTFVSSTWSIYVLQLPSELTSTDGDDSDESEHKSEKLQDRLQRLEEWIGNNLPQNSLQRPRVSDHHSCSDSSSSSSSSSSSISSTVTDTRTPYSSEYEFVDNYSIQSSRDGQTRSTSASNYRSSASALPAKQTIH